MLLRRLLDREIGLSSPSEQQDRTADSTNSSACPTPGLLRASGTLRCAPWTSLEFMNKAGDAVINQLGMRREFSTGDAAEGCFFDLSFSPDGSLLTSGQGNMVQVWDAETGGLLRSFQAHSEVVTNLKWLYVEEPVFYSASLDKSIKLWQNYQCIQTLTDHGDWIRSLAVSQNNRVLLSGCVSAEVCVWDIGTGSVLHRVENAHSHPLYPQLNTINSLHFATESDCLWASGARDGYIKFWDNRVGSIGGLTSVMSIAAHEKKVNNAAFTRCNRQLLSGGRDSRLCLWDLRSSSALESAQPKMAGRKSGAAKALREYDAHKCLGYNVSCGFFHNEKYVLTGSEDNKVYIYNKETTEVVRTLDGHSSVVHIVDTKDPMTIVCTAIDNCVIHYWTPCLDEGVQQTPSSSLDEESVFYRNNQSAVEEFLQKHGDEILKVFHQHNLTFSSDKWSRMVENPEANDVMSLMLSLSQELNRSLRVDPTPSEHLTTTSSTSSPSRAPPATVSSREAEPTETSSQGTSSRSSIRDPKSEKREEM